MKDGRCRHGETAAERRRDKAHRVITRMALERWKGMAGFAYDGRDSRHGGQAGEAEDGIAGPLYKSWASRPAARSVTRQKIGRVLGVCARPCLGCVCGTTSASAPAAVSCLICAAGVLLRVR